MAQVEPPDTSSRELSRTLLLMGVGLWVVACGLWVVGCGSVKSDPQHTSCKRYC